MAAKLNRISQKQRFELCRLLDEVCETVDGRAVYQDGWSDARIAKTVDVAPGSVAYVRKDVFGHLGDYHNNPKTKAVAAEVETLKDRVNVLEARLTSIENDLFGTKPPANGAYAFDDKL